MTKPMRSSSEIGRANLAKSKRAERAVVGYYRATLWPGAERTVRTGYRVAGRSGRDQGDIDGTPGVVTQVKTTERNHEPRVLAWLAETEAQRAAAHADVGLLVVHRTGHAHPASWWAYLRTDAVAELIGGDADSVAALGDLAGEPVRLTLAGALALLRHAGYGTAAGLPSAVECLPGLVEVVS